MSDSIRYEFERFRQRRAALTDPKVPPDDRDATLGSGAVFAVGLLTGGGYPGAAACVSVLLDSRFPGQLWPWSDAPA